MGREIGRHHPKEIGLNMQSMKLVGINDGCGENRKASKPLIEKRRRARINYSLAELKSIVVGAEKPHSPTARPPKLEKADILEMAVAYVKKMHERQSSNPDTEQSGYTAGFNQCLVEVCQFLDQKIDQDLKSRLMMHLNNSANSLSTAEPSMDDTSSSCSSTSRSHTPTSVTMETSSQMEYMSSSPFTDSEQEVPRTFSAENYPLPCASTDNYQHNSYAQTSTRSSQSAACGVYRDGSSSAGNGPLNLAKSVQRDSQTYSQSGSGSSTSQLGFFNCKIEPDSMWRPW